jgi:hypothetical protein
MKAKYLCVLIVLFFHVSFLKAEEKGKVIFVTVCGNGNNGNYYVQESHDYDGNVHTLKCTNGDNQPCKWQKNPQVVTNNNYLIPIDLVFKDNLGNVMPVDVISLNNALSNQISNGQMSGTILFANLLIGFSVTSDANSTNCKDVSIIISLCCEN